MDVAPLLLLYTGFNPPIRTTHFTANITENKTNIFTKLAKGLLNLQEEH